MRSPKINTYREIRPVIYSWSTPDLPKYAGWEKIGYTDQQTAAERVAQQASQLSIERKLEWSRRAVVTLVSPLSACSRLEQERSPVRPLDLPSPEGRPSVRRSVVLRVEAVREARRQLG